jgi:hypothetical protein
MHGMNLPENVTAVVAREFFDFYLGNQNSAEAFANIDRQVLTWCYDPAWLNQTRELFDALTDAAMDFDLAREDVPAVDHSLYGSPVLSIEQYDFYVTGEPFAEVN